MKITKEAYSKFIKDNLVPIEYRTYLDADLYDQAIEDGFVDLSHRFESLEFAEKFREKCFIENTSVEDYKSRVIEFNSIQLLTSIRFKNRVVTEPFVEIEYYNSEITDLAIEFEELKDFIFKEYKIFNPKQLRLMIRESDMGQFYKSNPIKDLGSYSAKLEELYEINLDYPGLKLEKIDQMSDEDYAKYLEEYNQFILENPRLTSVFPEPLNTINEIFQKDYGFKAYINNEWAGFILLARHKEFFFYGYLVWDKLIFMKFRGNHLSAIILNKAFHEFIPRENGFIFGTIQAENLGSIKTAEKTGRKNLVSSYFFKFD